MMKNWISYISINLATQWQAHVCCNLNISLPALEISDKYFHFMPPCPPQNILYIVWQLSYINSNHLPCSLVKQQICLSSHYIRLRNYLQKLQLVSSENPRVRILSQNINAQNYFLCCVSELQISLSISLIASRFSFSSLFSLRVA